MDGLRAVISTVISFANTRLNFYPFSFTIFQVWLGFGALSIIAYFIRKIFN